jgi:hypothetical protein
LSKVCILASVPISISACLAAHKFVFSAFTENITHFIHFTPSDTQLR